MPWHIILCVFTTQVHTVCKINNHFHINILSHTCIVHNFLCTLPRSAAPHTPRVLLLGPTGSGKSLQAAQLARQYRLVNIDCKELIKRTIASGSKLAVKMKPFHERGLLSELQVKVVWSYHHKLFLRNWALCTVHPTQTLNNMKFVVNFKFSNFLRFRV